MLRARSMSEVRLYMDLQPCPGCGHHGFTAACDVVERGDDLAAVSRGYCPNCGKERRFELLLDDDPVPGGGFGGERPSTIIDAGQWLALADDSSRRVPGSAAGLDGDARRRAVTELQRALAALDEVTKFLPAGADRLPTSAFFSTPGKKVYLAEPGRFQRARLEATRQAWRELARALAGR